MKKISILLMLLLFFSASFAQKDTTKYKRGLKYDDTGYQSTQMKAPLVRSMYGNSLPTSASLVDYAPTPLSQGSYSTCVGWASAYCALTIVEAKTLNLTDKAKITENAFSPGFLYKHIKDDGDANCAWGSSLSDALNILKTVGAVRYSELSINCPDNITSNLLSNAKNYRITDYAKLFGLTDGNAFKIQAVKKSLSENNPVVIGMLVPNSFYQATDVWMPTETHLGDYGGHAMCVVGYDDNKAGGAFLVQNSWGVEWGNSGYIWIKYATFADFTKYAYEIIGNMASGYPHKTIAEEKVLKGAIRYERSGTNGAGVSMNATRKGNVFRMKDSYKSGTQFRIYIRNSEPAYVYAFGTDATQAIFPVFPYDKLISPALNYSDNEVALPDEQHYIQMDKTVGTDYMCVLYSTEPLNFEQIIKDVESGYGTFAERIKGALGTKLLNNEEIDFSEGSVISFEAKSKTKTVVSMIVEIDHTL